jgi:putative transcriptional regulator
VNEPLRHFSDDLLRSFAVGTATEGANLAVACHLALCPTCRDDAATHESTLDALLHSQPADAPPPALRERLLAGLPASPAIPAPAPVARTPRPLPADMPALPPALVSQLGRLDDPTWRTLIPGIRAIDLGITSAWRARLLWFRPGAVVPIHDHGGPEHTVVFAGGLDDHGGHLGRGDAATMMPGESHRQRISADEPCVALIINEAPARPKTPIGRLLKWLTRS